MVATAILDRLLHHSHVITIRGDSYEASQRAAAEARRVRRQIREEIVTQAARSLQRYEGRASRAACFSSSKNNKGSLPHVAAGLNPDVA